MKLPKEKTAVVLLQFGGPDSPEAIEPFLFNLFNDKDIVQVPFPSLLQKPLAKRISAKRADYVRDKYGLIGGKSPINQATDAQVRALQKRLDDTYGTGVLEVILAMRYWKPFTEEAVQQLLTKGVKNVVLLPLYAQYSKTNAGSSYNEWDRVVSRLGARFIEQRIISYHLHPSYIAAMNARIDEALREIKDRSGVHLLFSAHGLPIDLVFQGDLYPLQIAETMEAIMKLRRNDLPYSLSYQSKVGPKQWLEPSVDQMIEKLAHEGVKGIVAIPIAFVSDHIETSYELGIELREEAEHEGITDFVVAKGLNDSPLFIDTLLDLTTNELEKMG
jgi:ferrochelatase